MIDHLTNLPVDLLLQQLTYLPFEDVVTVCQSNSKLHSYCSDSRYNNNWRQLIDNTFSSVYNYEDKLKKIWSKLHLLDGTYNYLVYTQLINLLDPLTQLMIYYRQGDIKSFNDKRYNKQQRFLTMFLLNKPEEMRKYESSYINRRPYYLLLQGKIPTVAYLNNMLYHMAEYGNIRGVKYMIETGADIHSNVDVALRITSEKGYLDVVRYLVEHGANIHALNDYPLKYASEYGHLGVVKYLVEQGADIHANNDEALRRASMKGHLDVVKYLVEQGSDIHALNDQALRQASSLGHLDVVKYLTEQNRMYKI